MDGDEQARLEAAGKALARGTDRYGAKQPDSRASLIQVRRLDNKWAQVRVADAVGLIAITTLQLNVQPKIPVPHLLHILEAGDVVPRFATGEGMLEHSDNLAALIAHWFITAVERILEEGLARDYRQHRDELSAVRGRILPLDTARLFYRGRVAVVADYEEYDFDTPLNRTMLHVARIIAGGIALPDALRRRALRTTKRMDGVGPLERADPAARLERRTSYYGDALSLARQILAATGRTLAAGDRRGWTFLFRTPIPVEAGIRAIAMRSLAGTARVRKGQLTLTGANLTINPDLVFDDGVVRAIGDVKYKLVGPEWERPDLYEAVAFAAGYHTDRGVVALFAKPGSSALEPAPVGRHTITQIYWPADAALAPNEAAHQFADQLQAWYQARAPAEPTDEA